MEDATPKARPAQAASAEAQPRSAEIPNVADLRPPLGLLDLLGILTTHELLSADQAKDIEVRSATLRSRVLRDRIGSVRSPAAARYDVSPAEIVAAAGAPHPKWPDRAIDEDLIAEALAGAASLPYLKIDPLQLDNELISKTLSRPFARRHVVVPVGKRGETVTLAVADPMDSGLRENLRQAVSAPIEYVVSSKRDILATIDRVYGFRKSVDLARGELGESGRSDALVALVEVRSNDELDGKDDEYVVAAVDYLLNYAFDQRASDIHLEPREEDALIRFRIDGVLHEIETVPYSVLAAISSRVKVMARMNIAERRRPQDGRIKTFRGDREVELRVASLPTAFGEKLVIRIFDPTILLSDLEDLGFTTHDREQFERWVTSPSGLILVTGPTGSGKTTTLYSTLRYLSGPDTNITTIEDPIEMVDPRLSQVQVNAQIDITFASALRSMLRQDPDVIMVGEIRDAETAQMAVQAALTGHLVFSTVHTRDSAGAVTRLLDLGVERFLLSSVLRGILAQRLVRKVCPRCGVEGTLNPDQVNALGIKVPVERRDRLRVKWGEGCVDCRHTGLFGRSGVFEMLDVGRRVRALINAGKDANEITEGARIEGMETLREAAVRKLAEGVTTFEEVVRVTADAQ